MDKLGDLGQLTRCEAEPPMVACGSWFKVGKASDHCSDDTVRKQRRPVSFVVTENDKTSELLQTVVIEHQAKLLQRRRRKFVAHYLSYTVNVQDQTNLIDLTDIVGVAPHRRRSGNYAHVAGRSPPTQMPRCLGHAQVGPCLTASA